MKQRAGKIFLLIFVTAVAVLSVVLLSACMDDCFHQFGEWSPLFDATCQAEGMDVRTCTLCGYSETETRPKSDHAYGAVHIDARPTCTDEGKGTKTCTVCNATMSVTLPVNPVSHSFDDALTCHDRICNACQTTVRGDGKHYYIEGTCACGATLPNLTTAEAAERMKTAMANTLAYRGDFSLTVTRGSYREVNTFYPASGELSLVYGDDTPPCYTLTQRGTLYYYDLQEKKAYRTSLDFLQKRFSLNLLGEIFHEYQLPADESKITDFSFSSDGSLTVRAEISFFRYTAEIISVERDGFLTELTVPHKESEVYPSTTYTLDFAPTAKVAHHPIGIRESDFEVLDTYSVIFYLNLGGAVDTFSVTTGDALALPLGGVDDENYQIDGWYYDMDFIMPFEESTVPYCPTSLNLYAKISLKPNLTALTLIVDTDTEPMWLIFPAGDDTYLEATLRAAFPTPPESTISGLYTRFGSTGLGLFTDPTYTLPLNTPLPAGEVTAYLKVEPYESLILQFPTDLTEYPADMTFYYPPNAVPTVSAETLENMLNSRTGKCFTLWLDSAYTVPYAGTLPKNSFIYLKHVPQEGCVFLDFRHAETGKLLYRIETLCDVEIYLPSADAEAFKDPTGKTACTGVWFDENFSQSAEGELFAPANDLILYCTFDLAPSDAEAPGQDASL